MMKPHHRNPAIALAFFSLVCPPALADPVAIADFAPEEVRSLGWQVVNDGVMGGLSRGRMEVSDKGVLKFSGTLSLENNGGFSSIRTETLERDLSAAEGVALRVKGDGRTYQMRFNTDARFRGMEVSFMAEFPTEKGKWTEVKVPFERFTGSFRGMKLKDEVFDPSKIRRMGLLLADKKPGSFELLVDWIRPYDTEDAAKDLVATALADGRFGILAKAVTEAGLAGALQGEGPFTVFAPTDEAFAKLPKGTVETLLKPENRKKLQSILKYHVLSGSTELATALGAGTADTLQGEPVSIRFSKGRVRVNDAVILDADIRCANGVIHVIDSVILPPEPANDLASVAKRAGQFGTLLAAIEAAGLTGALAGEGPFTVFAPTDDAFGKLPEETVKSLLQPANRGQLQAILKLHVVSGRVSAGDALNAGKAEALGGGILSFGIDAGRFKVNGATILKTDIECDNGVIHVIDAVLLPSAGGKNASAETRTMGAAERIEDAISRGVPIFNAGDHAKCAAIYRETLVALRDCGEMDAGVAKVLREVLAKADKMDDATRRAWILRSCLDHVHAALMRG